MRAGSAGLAVNTRLLCKPGFAFDTAHATLGKQVEALRVVGGPHRHGDFLVALGGVVEAGLLSRRALRSRVWRGYFWAALATLAVTVGFVKYQGHEGYSYGYYGYKMQHLLIVVLAVGVGALTLHLPVPQERRPPARMTTP